jgi:hypothetical protein
MAATGREAVNEDDRFPLSPVFVVELHMIFSNKKRHRSFLRPMIDLLPHLTAEIQTASALPYLPFG